MAVNTGQFKKGGTPHNKGKKGFTNAGTFRKGHAFVGSKLPLDEWRKNGGTPWNKGRSVLTNSGRTHFKPGMVPHNYKGGITKTQAYKNHYNRRSVARQLGASGSHTLDEWNELKARYKFSCLNCKRSEPEITISKDHVIPLVLGGTDNIDNIQPLCKSCNSRKHTRIIDYRI